MDWKEEKEKTIEMVRFALDELRHLQRGLRTYVRDYTVNAPSDAEVCVALLRVNSALDMATDYYNSLMPREDDNREDI